MGTARKLPEEVEKIASKSGKIRWLHKEGWSRSEIYKALGISYQFVDNVIKRPLKRLEKEKRKKEREENLRRFEELRDQGKI